MFGFSFGKLVVLVAVIAAVWYGFKYVSRMQYQRERKAEARDRVERRKERESVWSMKRPRSRKGAGDDGGGAEDMVQCAACKAYVPAKGARNCGRPDCPY